MAILAEGSLSAILGGFGTGKSLLATEMIFAAYKDGFRQLATNLVTTPKLKELLPDLEIQFMTNVQCKEFWNIVPKGSIVLIDEIHGVYDALEFKKLAQEKDGAIKKYWSQTRKQLDRVIIITQRWNDIPVFIRERCGHCITCYKFPMSLWFLRQHHEVVQGKRVPCSWLGFRFATWHMIKKYAGCYDTHAMAGETGLDRPTATVVSKRKPRKFHLAHAVMIGLALWFCFMRFSVWYAARNNPVFGTVPASPVSAVAPTASTAPALFPVRRVVERPHPVAPPPPPRGLEFSYATGQYTYPEAQAVEVGDQVVTCFMPAGVKLQFPRDLRSEYRYVVSQRDQTLWLNYADATTSEARRARSAPAAAGGSEPGRLLPGGNLPPASARPDPAANPPLRDRGTESVDGH